jgi:hypothetical protein
MRSTFFVTGDSQLPSSSSNRRAGRPKQQVSIFTLLFSRGPLCCLRVIWYPGLAPTLRWPSLAFAGLRGGSPSPLSPPFGPRGCSSRYLSHAAESRDRYTAFSRVVIGAPANYAV